MAVKSCPCCGKSMLQHVRTNLLYWYCSSCTFSMPAPSENGVAPLPQTATPAKTPNAA
ncbi:MAG: hypothetical protein J7641_21050 [Cyanobacteria bacterium SID2]|nr:hypothetical protein [Cyanobacteria bacterium SID2]MBP0006403.1 hypothetical protein [Cyanobacteria bacterium SBC]